MQQIDRQQLQNLSPEIADQIPGFSIIFFPMKAVLITGVLSQVGIFLAEHAKDKPLKPN